MAKSLKEAGLSSAGAPFLKPDEIVNVTFFVTGASLRLSDQFQGRPAPSIAFDARWEHERPGMVNSKDEDTSAAFRFSLGDAPSRRRYADWLSANRGEELGPLVLKLSETSKGVPWWDLRDIEDDDDYEQEAPLAKPTRGKGKAADLEDLPF